MAHAHRAYDPARDITVKAAETLVGGRLVKASAAKVDGENISVNYCDAGELPFGVIAHDVADTKLGHCYRRGSVCEIEASATIAANVAVKAAADGKIAAASAGDTVIGITLTGGDATDLLLVDTFAAPAIVEPAADWPN